MADCNEMVIELKNVKFFAFHGLYEEERKTGGHFAVDLTAHYNNSVDQTIIDLEDTINYEKLYEILKAEMKEPRALLESIAISTTEKIHNKFPRIHEIQIRIEKKDPPITNFSGSVAVTYKKQF